MNLRRKVQWCAFASILVFFVLYAFPPKSYNREDISTTKKYEFKPIFAFTDPPLMFVMSSYVVLTRQSLVTIILHENDKKHFLNQTTTIVNPETEFEIYCNFEDGTKSRAVHMVWNHDESGRFFECRLSEETIDLYRDQGYLKVDIWDKKTNKVLMPIKASSVMPPPPRRATSKPHYLTICGPPMRRAYPYIDEWIEYNKIIGVDKIILHACQADKNEIFNTSGIRRNIKEGFVDLQHWCPPGIIDRKRSMQPSMYLDCLYRYMDHTEWMAIIDPDEYIDPINNLTILPLLNKYSGKKVSALRLQNMFYGPCPEENKDESKLVIERFTQRAKKAHGKYMPGLPKFHRSKNIYNTNHLFYPSVHFAVYGAPDHVPDAYKDARINHFYCANRVRRAPEVEINVSAPNFAKKYSHLIREKLK